VKIGNNVYFEILVTDSKGNLLASITDENIIEEKDCRIVCVPIES